MTKMCFILLVSNLHVLFVTVLLLIVFQSPFTVFWLYFVPLKGSLNWKHSSDSWTNATDTLCAVISSYLLFDKSQPSPSIRNAQRRLFALIYMFLSWKKSRHKRWMNTCLPCICLDSWLHATYCPKTRVIPLLQIKGLFPPYECFASAGVAYFFRRSMVD